MWIFVLTIFAWKSTQTLFKMGTPKRSPHPKSLSNNFSISSIRLIITTNLLVIKSSYPTFVYEFRSCWTCDVSPTCENCALTRLTRRRYLFLWMMGIVKINRNLEIYVQLIYNICCIYHWPYQGRFFTPSLAIRVITKNLTSFSPRRNSSQWQRSL